MLSIKFDDEPFDEGNEDGTEPIEGGSDIRSADSAPSEGGLRRGDLIEGTVVKNTPTEVLKLSSAEDAAEEVMLPACLASVAGAVDEIVVVDTGSRDRTVAIARAAGAVTRRCPDRDRRDAYPH